MALRTTCRSTNRLCSTTCSCGLRSVASRFWRPPHTSSNPTKSTIRWCFDASRKGTSFERAEGSRATAAQGRTLQFLGAEEHRRSACCSVLESSPISVTVRQSRIVEERVERLECGGHELIKDGYDMAILRRVLEVLLASEGIEGRFRRYPRASVRHRKWFLGLCEPAQPRCLTCERNERKNY